MGEKLIPLFRDAYLEISFLTHQEVEPGHYCATYDRAVLQRQ
jgi:hypothetical protein